MHYAVVFLAIALLAALPGFGAAEAAAIAQVLLATLLALYACVESLARKR